MGTPAAVDIDVSDMPADYRLRTSLPGWTLWAAPMGGAYLIASSLMQHRWIAAGVWCAISLITVLVQVMARRRRLGVHLEPDGMRVWTNDRLIPEPRRVDWDAIDQVVLTGGRTQVPSMRLRSGEVLRLHAVPAADARLLAQKVAAAGVPLSLLINGQPQPLIVA